MLLDSATCLVVSCTGTYTKSDIGVCTDLGICVDIMPVDTGLLLSGADDVLCLVTNTVSRVQLMFCVLGSAQTGALSVSFHFSLH